MIQKDINVAQEEQSNPGKINSVRAVFSKVLPLLIVALIVGGGFYYLARTQPQVLGLSQGVDSQAEAEKLLSDLGKLIALPGDEQPTIATVTDIERVREQVFFRNAQNGDKVVVYTNARKAILYRPSENRIIEVGAVNINQATPTPSPDGKENSQESTEEETLEESPTPEPEETPEP